MSREGDLNFPENFVFIACLQEAEKRDATRERHQKEKP